MSKTCGKEILKQCWLLHISYATPAAYFVRRLRTSTPNLVVSRVQILHPAWMHVGHSTCDRSSLPPDLCLGIFPCPNLPQLQCLYLRDDTDDVGAGKHKLQAYDGMNYFFIHNGVLQIVCPNHSYYLHQKHCVFTKQSTL